MGTFELFGSLGLGSISLGHVYFGLTGTIVVLGGVGWQRVGASIRRATY